MYINNIFRMVDKQDILMTAEELAAYVEKVRANRSVESVLNIITMKLLKMTLRSMLNLEYF
jgi:hypothetical protein